MAVPSWVSKSASAVWQAAARQLGRFTARQKVGASATGIAVVLTLLLAVLAAQKPPPSLSDFVLLAAISALLQLFGASLFAANGRADPTLAIASIRRLLRAAARAGLLRQALEEVYAGAEPTPQLIGQMSAQSSFIEEAYVEAIEDWRLFHPDAVARAEETVDADGD